MSRDSFFMIPWEEPSSSLWYPRRRYGRYSPWGNMEHLWNEAMKEIDCMQSALEHGRGLGSGVESHMEGDSSEPGKYVMSIPLGRNIGPEDLKVSMKDQEGMKVMTVEAKKEQKSQDGNSRVYQEYVRKFTLPPNLDMDHVKSTLHDGYLRVEAKLPQIEHKEPEKPKEIPIEMARVG